jgi:hypothetical protein
MHAPLRRNMNVPQAFLYEPDFSYAYRPTIENPSASVWGIMSPQHELGLRNG